MGVRKQIPVSEAAVRVEFTLTDESYPFVGVSAAEDCQMLLEELVPRDAGRFAEFFSVVDADADRIHDAVAEHGGIETRQLAEYESGGLFEFVVGEDCPAVALGKRGALPRDLSAVDGEGHIAAEIPPSKDETAIVAGFLDEHSDAELVTKRQQPFVTPLFSYREFRRAVEDYLTDRQREVLTAAHEAGYYESPRETTGDEIADSLGIAAPTFHQHLRAAERKLVAVFFEAPPSSESDR